MACFATLLSWLLLVALISFQGEVMANDLTVYGLDALLGCNKEGIYFISDYDGNQVKAFKAQSGQLIGPVLPINNTYLGLVGPPPGGPVFTGTQGSVSNTSIAGPNGVVIYDDVLYLVNQNGDTIFNGGVLAFQLPSSVKNGALDASQLPLQRLFPDPVDQFAPYSPVAPRGIVIGGPQPALFVADAMGAQVVVVAAKPPYAFLGTLNATGIPAAFDFTNPSLRLGPQGLAFGPDDGLLYVTVRSFALSGTQFGVILRFDISILPGTFKDVFASTEGASDCSQFLHRPEGLTWGPAFGVYKEKLLYVTGYTASSGSPPPVDNVVSKFETTAPVFGPKGKLYVTINSFTTGNNFNQYTGGYRAYSVDNTLGSTIVNHTARFESILRPNNNGGPLSAPFYSTFGRTDPGTLEYQCLV